MFTQRDRQLLPPWCWLLAVSLSYGDVATTIIGRRVGIADLNPLYAHVSLDRLGWLLLVTHTALLVLLAVLARLHRRFGIVGALTMSLLIYLPAVAINCALIVQRLHH